MTTGTIISATKTAIRSTITGLHDVRAVYGFGSFFRSNTFTDVDLLIVLRDGCIDLVGAFYDVQDALGLLSSELSLDFDLTVLTQREFLERPLKEMDVLVPILERESDAESEPSTHITLALSGS